MREVDVWAFLGAVWAVGVACGIVAGTKLNGRKA